MAYDDIPEKEFKQMEGIVMKYCPADCIKRKTCFRGQPLPVDKSICYTPPSEVQL